MQDFTDYYFLQNAVLQKAIQILTTMGIYLEKKAFSSYLHFMISNPTPLSY